MKYKIREFARLIGTLIVACPAIKYGWLYTKILERKKYIALQNSNENYSLLMTVSDVAKQDLNWWLNNIKTSKNPIREENYKRIIFSEAFLTGWGAFSKGQKTHGWWSEKEKKSHINQLELKAAFFGLQCFSSNDRNCEVLLRMDNTTAISYVNKVGGIRYPKLTELSREIWKFCE